MASQNINQYVFSKLFLSPTSENMDISLASDEKNYDEEVVFSENLIAYFNGNRLPFQFDLNDLDSSPEYTLNYKEYNPNNILLSTNYWNPDGLDLSCFSAFTLCDIGLTGTDNGLVDQMSGETITLTEGLVGSGDTFNRLMFDRRMKLFQVTGYTSSPNERFSGYSATTLYEVVSKTGATEGVYHELYGGFYQGFYKLFDYDYQIFPDRVAKGWTVELLLKPRIVDEYFPSSGETTLNEYYPDNKNIFFYLGARAENKYYHYADGTPTSDSGYTRVTSGLTCLETCACSDTGVTNSDCITVYPQSAVTVEHLYGPCGYYNEVVLFPELDPAWDSISNAIALKFCGDDMTNPKLGVKVLRFVGDCVITGSCETTGITYTTGYTITEYCSPNGINDVCTGTTYNQKENWYQIDVVFERYSWFDKCDLYYKGGLGIITNDEYVDSLLDNSVALIQPPITHDQTDPEMLNIIQLNEEWLLEKQYRMGNLKFYVNGKLFYTIEDFEEVIPRGFNTRKERQIGVPFNISVGGGTQGLHENLIFSGCPTGLTNTYIQDPESIPNNILSATTLSGLSTNILLEQNFAGTFEGALAQFRMYIEPLSAAQIQHNFRLLKGKFDLIDTFCDGCPPYNRSVEMNNYSMLRVTDNLSEIFNPFNETGWTMSFCYKLIRGSIGTTPFVMLDISGGGVNTGTPPYWTFVLVSQYNGFSGEYELLLNLIVNDGVNPNYQRFYIIGDSSSLFLIEDWHKIVIKRDATSYIGWSTNDLKFYIDDVEKPLYIYSTAGATYDNLSAVTTSNFTMTGFGVGGTSISAYFDEIYACLTPRTEEEIINIIGNNLMDIVDSDWDRQWWWRITSNDTNSVFTSDSETNFKLIGINNTRLSTDYCG